MGRHHGHGDVLPWGEGYGVVELHALIRDPIECDSRRERVMFHRRSVPSPHNPPCFSGEGGGHRSGSVPCLCPMSTSSVACPPSVLPESPVTTSPGHLPGSLLADTILSMSLYVSSNIPKLWRTACLSGFGMALRNLANILSAHILV